MGRQVRSDQAESSFQGKVALELELEGCLAVHQAEEEEGHSNQGDACHSKDAHATGESMSEGSEEHAKGVWFYSGERHDQGFLLE